MRVRTVLLLSLPATLSASTLLAADVYRHVDKDGVVHYSDQPPTPGAKPVVLPPVQIVDPLSGPGSGAKKLEVDQPRVELSIVSPAPEETFRGDDRRIPVSVRLTRPLPEGYGLRYMLDGSPQNATATRELGFTLAGAERGEHLVSVAVVDARGLEVARTPPVIVHMKPPAARRSAP
ncbi:MAG: DUF4124 domain-containing protein [Panacagrimonas sp.]